MKLRTALMSGVLFVFYISLHSQTLTKTGFIVLQKGDTLKGEIKARSWHKTPQTIFFRKNDQEEFLEYTTASVQYFEADKTHYLRAEVWIDNSPIEMTLDADQLLPEQSRWLDKETVFLKCLVLGSHYDLFEFADDEKNHYYLKERTSQITLLPYRVYTSGQNVVVNHIYKDILKTLNGVYQDDPQISQAIKTSHYDAASLSQIIEAINNFAGKVNYRYPTEQKKKNVTFIVGAVAGITQTIPTKMDYFYPGRGSVAGIMAGIDLSLGYSYNGGESFFRFDVILARNEYTTNYGEYKVSQYNIVPTIQLRVPLVTLRNFETHLGAGFKTPVFLSSSAIIYGRKYLSDEHYPSVNITTSGQMDFQLMNKWEIGIAAYSAPAADLKYNVGCPMHYYMWVAYRFK